jgi:hypothetical protein
MKIIKSANFKKVSGTMEEGRELLKQKGYWFVKNPMFGGEEWKNEQGDSIYYVPGPEGGMLSLDEYREKFVKMFSPRTREHERIKQEWLS